MYPDDGEKQPLTLRGSQPGSGGTSGESEAALEGREEIPARLVSVTWCYNSTVSFHGQMPGRVENTLQLCLPGILDSGEAPSVLLA